MLKFMLCLCLMFLQFGFGLNAFVGGKDKLTTREFFSSDYQLVRTRLTSFLSNSNNLCGSCVLEKYICGSKQVVAGVSLDVEFVAHGEGEAEKKICLFNIWYKAWENFFEIKPKFCRPLTDSSSVQQCDIKFPYRRFREN